jgi:hypothetical protein
MTRAKFKINRATKTDYGYEIEAWPVYSSDENHENRKFWSATPSGSIRLTVTNAAAGEYFEEGREYYVDFTKAEQS